MRASVGMVKERLDLLPDELAEFCQRWRVTELSLIGSMPPDDVGSDESVEFLVRFEPGVMRRYADAVAMERELADLVGRDVELVDCRSVVDWSDNLFRRKAILESGQVVYSASGGRG